MSVRFSVIVPIYNAANYLNECINSVLAQTYNNYELILIDDGSLDESYKICQEYAVLNHKIKAFSKKNEGLSATRNFGLGVSTGEYILFLDSDDFIEPDSLERFNNVICKTNAEIIAGYAYSYSEIDGKRPSRVFLNHVDDIMSGVDFYNFSLYQNNVRACAPYYITKKTLISDNNLSFKKGIYHEDELWTPILLSLSEKVVDMKYYFYNNRITNTKSITRDPTKKKKRALDRITVAKCLDEFFDSVRKEKRYRCFQDNIAAQYMYAVYDGELYKDKSVMIDRMFPLNHSKTLKYQLKAISFAVSPALSCFLRKLK